MSDQINMDGLYRNLFENSVSVMLIIDPESGQIIAANRAACQYYGYTENQLIKMHIQEINTLSRHQVHEEMQRAKNEKRNYFNFKHRLANGEVRDVEVVSSPVKAGDRSFLYSIIHDIATRNAYQKKYQQLAYEFELIIDHLPALLFYKDTQNNYIRVNKYVADAHNLDKNQLEGVNCFELYPKSQAQGYWDDDLEVIESKKAKLFIEEPWQTETGAHWLSTSKIPFVDDSGQVKGVIGLALDITARKEAEEALKKEQKFVQTVVNSAQTGVFIYDLKKKTFKFTNSRCTELIGYTKDELNAMTAEDFRSLFHEDDTAGVSDHIKDVAIDHLNNVYEHEFRLKRSDGSWIWCLSWDSVFERDVSGEVLSFIGTFQDITDRKSNELIYNSRLHLLKFAEDHSVDELFEETLNEAERLTNSRIGFYHFVEDDQVTLVLQNWSTNTKSKFCQAQGSGAHYPIDHAGVWVDCVHQRKPVIHNDYANLKHKKGLPEGHAEVVRELVVPVLRGDKIVAILGVGNKQTDYDQYDVKRVSSLADLSWDIVERKRTEEKLIKFNEALERSNKDLQDFAYIASHDLQEPLRKIMAFGDRLRVKYKEALTEQGKFYIDRIYDASERMRTLIDDLLTYSRVTTKSRPFEAVDLNEQLNIVLSDMEITIKEKQAEINVEPLPVVYGDNVQLRQVMQNLLSNAIKFSRPDVPPKIQIQEHVSENEMYCIALSDNGMGFDQQYAEKIFMPFNRLHSRGEFEGTGIGLAICKKIVDHHKGKIVVSSNLEKGTVFYLHLPKERSKDGSKSNKK